MRDGVAKWLSGWVAEFFKQMKRFLYIVVLGLLPWMSVSCEREGFVTDDGAAKLDFSADTVAFDTVFTTVGTPTAMTGFTQTDVRKDFSGNWKTETAGEITFDVTARNIGILYQRTIDGKSGQYDVFVDGQFVRTLNGHFGNGWGNYAEADEVFTADAESAHTVTVKMSENSTAEGFILLGLMTS